MSVRLILAAFAVVFLGASLAGTAKTWYVATDGSDSNPCTQRAPCATIVRASTLAHPGDTVLVEPGRYEGPISTNASGTPSARITYLSGKRWGAVIVQGPHGSAWANHGSYVVIDGFELVGDPQSLGTDGLETDGAYTIIQHNKAHGFLARTCNDWGGAGIHLNSPHDQVLGNWVYQNGPYPCEWVHGIYFEQPYGLAAENIAFQNGGYGIHEWHQSSHITAVNNTLFNNGCGGIVVGNEGLPKLGVSVNDHSFTANNIAYRNGPCRSTAGKLEGYGLQECCRPAETGSCNVYHNNVVYGNYTSDVEVYIPAGPGNSGNIVSDPKFVNYQPDGSGDYHLQRGSPGIGAGLASDSACGIRVSFPTFDFSGNPRPGALGPGASGKAKFDIGAYQSPY